MKFTRKNRKVKAKTRKQKGGGVVSKPIKTAQNLNLSKYLKTKELNVQQLPAKSQMNYYTTKRKLKQRENDLAKLTASGVSSGQAIGAGAGSAQNYENRKKELETELTALREKMKQYEPDKTTKGRFKIQGYKDVNFGKVDESPVILYTIKLKETDNNTMGPNYDILRGIFLLRQKAFPEDYGKDAKYLNEKLLKVFPIHYKIVNGVKKSTTEPIANATSLIYEAPFHCKPVGESAINNIYTFLYYTKKELERIKYLKSHGVIRIPEPTILSSCFVNICNLESGLKVAELMGVATDPKYQGQGFAKKMITQVLNMLATTGYGSVDFTVTNGELETSNSGLIDYVWLYYDKNKPELANFYKKFGFKELTANETDPELKQLYIGREYLLKDIRKEKMNKWIQEVRETKRRYSGEPVEFVEEKDYLKWMLNKEEYLYRTYGQMTDAFGNPVPDFYTKKTEDDFPTASDYKEAIFDKWAKLKPNYPMIITQEVKEWIDAITPEEEYEALEFERENVQMVLSMADWVYEMNKQSKQ